MRHSCLTAFALLSLTPLAANAVVINYELEPYSFGGYSANWLHSADGCQGGPGNSLFMCNGGSSTSFLLGISGGNLSGEFDGTAMTGITGSLNLAPNTMFDGLAITGGALGGSGPWYLDYTLHAPDYSMQRRFSFVDLGMGAGLPNSFSPDRFILWGQNQDAYMSAMLGDWAGPVGGPNFLPTGIDLHAVAVPEPGTLALLSGGLLLLGFGRSRSRITGAHAAAES